MILQTKSSPSLLGAPPHKESFAQHSVLASHGSLLPASDALRGNLQHTRPHGELIGEHAPSNPRDTYQVTPQIPKQAAAGATTESEPNITQPKISQNKIPNLTHPNLTHLKLIQFFCCRVSQSR